MSKKLAIQINLLHLKWVTVFDTRCVKLDLYESNWCVINDTLSFTLKLRKVYLFLHTFLIHIAQSK